MLRRWVGLQHARCDAPTLLWSPGAHAMDMHGLSWLGDMEAISVFPGLVTTRTLNRVFLAKLWRVFQRGMPRVSAITAACVLT